MVSEASAVAVESPVQRREKGKCPLKKLCHDDCDGWKREFEDCLCLGGSCGKGVYLLDAYVSISGEVMGRWGHWLTMTHRRRAAQRMERCRLGLRGGWTGVLNNGLWMRGWLRVDDST